MSDIETPATPGVLRRIGTIRTPFHAAVGTPIQSVYGQGCERRVEVHADYVHALADLDGFERTPLLDIKPYVPGFDSYPGSRAGWFEDDDVDRRVDDGRFVRDDGRPE